MNQLLRHRDPDRHALTWDVGSWVVRGIGSAARTDVIRIGTLRDRDFIHALWTRSTCAEVDRVACLSRAVRSENGDSEVEGEKGRKVRQQRILFMGGLE